MALRMGRDGDLILAPTGGAIGTALAVLPGLVAKPERTRRVSCQAILVGACSALIFPVAAFAKAPLLLFVGIAAWQVVVASVLATALPD